MYHEYGHYLQNYGPNKNIQTMVSEASVVGNNPYYDKNRNELPHEIAAEMAGVRMAWDAMSDTFSKEKADKCMLEYINYRSSGKKLGDYKNTKTASILKKKHDGDKDAKIVYMLNPKDGGYKDRLEVEAAFVSAMERSLHEPRTARGDFLYDAGNEFSQLLTQGKRLYTESPNAHHISELIGTMPGSQKDRKMAALAIHLHKDILTDHPELKGENLTIEHEFGKPLAVNTLPDPKDTKDAKTDKRSRTWDILQARMEHDYGDDDTVGGPDVGG